MTKLTKSLADALDAVRPYDGDEDFMRELVAKRSPIPGYPPRRLLHDIAELQRLGMLEVFTYRGVPDCFDLTAAGRDYRRNRVADVAKAVGRHAFNLLVGASGGVAVLLLDRLLAQ